MVSARQDNTQRALGRAVNEDSLARSGPPEGLSLHLTRGDYAVQLLVSLCFRAGCLGDNAESVLTCPIPTARLYPPSSWTVFFLQSTSPWTISDDNNGEMDYRTRTPPLLRFFSLFFFFLLYRVFSRKLGRASVRRLAFL